ncbi:MAG: DEAD/DEAH box helicase [Proteobacteria bacterium]|nr:DEAD/DEAH box helicase [Pseudomonadota bacterium]
MPPILTVTSDCLLAGIDLPLEQALKDRLTIENPKYNAAKRYGRWIGKKLKPLLKYYDPVPDGLRFPRGFANQAVLLCREFCGTDPEIVDRRRLLPETVFTFSGELRPYQKVAVAAAAGKSFGVIEAGTGSGKTVMALDLIAKRRQPTLVVVHTKELLFQWQERVRTFLGVEPGQVGAGKFIQEPITVGIVNSVRSHLPELIPHFGHLVVDECHRVPANLFTDVVSHFDCHYLLGLSATAFRNEEQMTRLIYYFMGDRLHQVDRDELKATGAILAPQVVRTATSFTYRYRGDYQALIKALVRHEGRNLQILSDIVTAVHEGCGTVLVVSDRVDHCRFFVEKLKAKGVKAELLHGGIDPGERSTIVTAVQGGEIEVLVATLQLIGEGFDCPGLSSLFLTTPITFEGRLLQVIGRIMRPAANKQARVFDYLDENVPALMRSARARSLVLSQL